MTVRPDEQPGTTAADASAEPSARRSELDLTKRNTGPVWRQYLRAMGPGLVTGASDDDPSGIATYSQAGAQYGLSFLWTALLTLPLMAAVQEICDRTALATGTGLGELAVRHFGRAGRAVLAVLLVALIMANALNIGADLVAIGSGMQLLHAGPTWLWALLAGVLITTVLVLGSFARIALVFKVLCAALLSYLVVAVLVTHQWGSVLSHALIPHIELTKAYLALLVAVLGTTISPYLFFWQSAHRLEEMRDEPEGGARAQPLRRQAPARAQRKQSTSRLDVFTGMAFSNLVMFAIIVATAQTLNAHGKTGIQSAAQAAEALRPFAGHFASALFALGFIGSGLLAIPVLAGAGSVGMAGLLRKQWGFSRSVRKAPVFYGLVALGAVGGTALSLLHVNPIKLLIYVAVINGVAAAPFLVVVMRVSGSKRIMGDYVNGNAAKILGWLTATVMAAAAIALFATGGITI
ncbi:MAG TPA: Nramp family divalent metal transporter [Streptosporangiaceae bacterium]|nr:Nramp family divalent metal transporter [Streptosporangiaceae bacterium]